MAYPPRFGMSTFGTFPPPPPQIFFNPLISTGHQNTSAPANSTKQSDVTTVFVGNIPEKCTDEFIEKILSQCGPMSWKCVNQGTDKHRFGFCKYEKVDGTLCAIRVLNNFHLGDRKLVVKADDNSRAELRKTAIAHRKRLGKPDLKLADDEMPADDNDLKNDEEVRLKILNWIETDYPELVTVTEDGELSEKEGRRRRDGKDDRERKNGRDKDRSKRRRSRSAERSRREDKRSRRTRSPVSPRKKRRRSSSSSSRSASSASSRSRSSSSDASRSHSPPRKERKEKKKRERSCTRSVSSEDSDDARERRALRKICKEKEAAYISRLRKWEAREKQKAKQYEREERKEKDRKKIIQKEAKKLKNFLEEYDDEKDDPKFYKSSQLFQRKREFEKEREADSKDRHREQQEIEELKQQIKAENTEKDEIKIEEEARKRLKEKEDEAKRKRRADSGSPNPHRPLGHSAQAADDSSSSEESDEGSDREKEKTIEEEEDKSANVTMHGTLESPSAIDSLQNQKITAGWKAIEESSTPSRTSASPSVLVSTGVTNSPRTVPSTIAPIAQRLNGVFGIDDDDEAGVFERKKKLRPFEITKEERMQVMTQEEKKELTRNIIKKIPTAKDELFAYPIEWDYLDDQVMEQRVKPWVSRKVAEFLGEEEKQLVDFVCDKIACRTPPDQILKDIAMIIDEDADMFVVKMWRLLIYESQAKKIGISN